MANDDLFFKPDPEQSEASKDPTKRLAAAIVRNAIFDLGKPDILKQLTALEFFLDDISGAVYWLEYAGIPCNPDLVFEHALTRRTRKQRDENKN